jgi:wyosine [tRNA(Phe)-imidazoG37] synthetase (radical SAM superfamily)
MVIEQLRDALAGGDRPDSVTLAGSGEPTLHSRIGEVIATAKRLTTVPVTLLTNGSLFDLADVRSACAQADRVVPSLDAGSEQVFQRINRPVAGLTLARHVDGLVAFRSEFRGQLWLEVMLVDGINATDDEVARMRLLADRIRPDRIQLNTVIRPPTEDIARAIDPERMDEICRLMGPRAEMIADYEARHMPGGAACRRDDVLATLERRPCTVDDVAAGLGIHRNEVIKHLTSLLNAGSIARRRRGDDEYYEAVSRDPAAPADSP